MEVYYGEFIIEKKFPEGSQRIATTKQAQEFTARKVLPLFFPSTVTADIVAEKMKALPDYETMNVPLLAVVFYIWETRGKEIPKDIVDFDPGYKLKKGEVFVTPTLEAQREVFHTEKINREMKADIVRYMRVILGT